MLEHRTESHRTAPRGGRLMNTLAQLAEQHPVLNWMILLGSWAVSFLQPLALLVTVALGGLQLYLLIKKTWFSK